MSRDRVEPGSAAGWLDDAVSQAWASVQALEGFRRSVDSPPAKTLLNAAGIDESELQKYGETLAAALLRYEESAPSDDETHRVLGLLALPFINAAQRIMADVVSKRSGQRFTAKKTTVGGREAKRPEFAGRTWRRSKSANLDFKGTTFWLRGFGGQQGKLIKTFLDQLPWHEADDPFCNIGAFFYGNEVDGPQLLLRVPPSSNDLVVVVRSGRHTKEAPEGRKYRVPLDAGDPPESLKLAVSELWRLVGERLDSQGIAAAPANAIAPAPASDAARNDALDQLHDHVHSGSAVVLQGPPGTGKTFRALQLIDRLSGPMLRRECRWTVVSTKSDEEIKELPVLWEIVQLHPSYTYEDLVRGLTTKPADGGVAFVVEDKLLVQLAKAADKRDKPTVLILDEMNRCNLSAVLGELILVLEKGYRDMPVRLQYVDPAKAKDATLRLPENLWIIGTMNTADRSIAMVDFAIRRRFRFIDVEPDARVIEKENGRIGPECADAAVAAFKAFQKLIKDADRARLAIGHSYFLLKPTELGEGTPWQAQLADRIIYEVLPLLREYAQEGFLASTRIDSDWSREWMPADAKASLGRALTELGLA